MVTNVLNDSKLNSIIIMNQKRQTLKLIKFQSILSIKRMKNTEKKMKELLKKTWLIRMKIQLRLKSLTNRLRK